jgi:hypothetical protein
MATPPDRANLPRHRHVPSPKLSARTTATPPGPRRQPTHLLPTKPRYGRFSMISCEAQPSSRALETFSRPDPGAATPRPSKSAARWCVANAVDRRSIPPFASVGRSADGLGEAADVSQTGRVDLGPGRGRSPQGWIALPSNSFHSWTKLRGCVAEQLSSSVYLCCNHDSRSARVSRCAAILVT